MTLISCALFLLCLMVHQAASLNDYLEVTMGDNKVLTLRTRALDMDVRGKVVQARIPVHQDVPLIADLALSRKLVDMKVHQEGVPSEFASKTGELRTSLKGCKVAELRERYEMHGKKDKQPEHTSFVDVTFKCRTLVTDKELRPRYPENSQLESTEAFAIVPGISWGDLNTERLRNFDFSHNLTTGILDVVMYGLGGSNSDVLNSSEIARIDFVFKSPEVWGCKFAVYECHSSSKILTRRSKAEFGLFAKKCNVKKANYHSDALGSNVQLSLKCAIFDYVSPTSIAVWDNGRRSVRAQSTLVDE